MSLLFLLLACEGPPGACTACAHFSDGTDCVCTDESDAATCAYLYSWAEDQGVEVDRDFVEGATCDGDESAGDDTGG